MPTMSDRVLVRLSYNDMEAFIMLPPPGMDEEYTVSTLMDALKAKGVTTGVDSGQVSAMVGNQMYDVEILVAKGTRAVDGVDGYYEYKFNTRPDKKPKIRPDGSVDYGSVNSIEQVAAGQVIALYHPAVEGKDGVTVKGKTIQAKRAREQLPLKGKGFERANDGKSYTASMDGKIEIQNDRIVISPIHEIFGDADAAGGNIAFRGDVVVHGNVENGVSIKAAGSITVDGIVEICQLEAGKEIILRSGMLGGNRAFVKAKGNITARFFEFTRIECEGSIQADVLMDCDVSCSGRIVLDGPRGSIIGGKVRAVQGIEVTSLGNDAEKKTEVFVGAGVEVYSRLHALEKQIETAKETLDKIEKGLQQFAALEKQRGVSYAKDPRRLSLLRVKIQDTATLAAKEAEAKKLTNLAEGSRGACVSVLRETYPGVIVNIDDMMFTVKNIGRSVEFYKMPDKINTRPCYRGYGTDVK